MKRSAATKKNELLRKKGDEQVMLTREEPIDMRCAPGKSDGTLTSGWYSYSIPFANINSKKDMYKEYYTKLYELFSEPLYWYTTEAHMTRALDHFQIALNMAVQPQPRHIPVLYSGENVPTSPVTSLANHKDGTFEAVFVDAYELNTSALVRVAVLANSAIPIQQQYSRKAITIDTRSVASVEFSNAVEIGHAYTSESDWWHSKWLTIERYEDGTWVPAYDHIWVARATDEGLNFSDKVIQKFELESDVSELEQVFKDKLSRDRDRQGKHVSRLRTEVKELRKRNRGASAIPHKSSHTDESIVRDKDGIIKSQAETIESQKRAIDRLSKASQCKTIERLRIQLMDKDRRMSNVLNEKDEVDREFGHVKNALRRAERLLREQGIQFNPYLEITDAGTGPKVRSDKMDGNHEDHTEHAA